MPVTIHPPKPEPIRLSNGAATWDFAAPANPTREIGVALVSSLGNLAPADYNSDLEGTRGYEEFERMARSDPTVKAALSVIKLPLLAAEWRIDPASDSDLDKQIAAVVEEDLLRGMTTSWQTTLRTILRHLDFGVYPFFKVFEVRKGKTGGPLRRLRKLSPRPPRTITQWESDDNGGPKRISQGTGRSQVWMDIEDLLVFTNDQEGPDLRGVSILRAARKAWKIKEALEKVAVVSAETRGNGILTFTVDSRSAAVNEGVKDVGMTAGRVHERNYLRLPEGISARIMGVEGGLVDPLPSLEFFNRQILLSVLAEFLALGSDGGAYALSRDKSSFFLMALNAVGANVCNTVDSFLIRPWVDANWGGKIDDGAYPRLTHSRLDTREVGAISSAVATLMQAGALTRDREVENAIRELFDFAKLEEEDPAAIPDAAPGDPEEDEVETYAARWSGVDLASEDAPTPAPEAPPAGGERLASLIKFEAVGVRPRFDVMASALDRAEAAALERLRRLQEKQARRLAAKARAIVKNRPPDVRQALDEVEIPSDEEREAIRTELAGLYGLGAGEYARELSQQGVTPNTPDDDAGDRELMDEIAGVAASRLADRHRQALSASVIQQLVTGYDADAIDRVMTAAPDSLLAMLLAGAAGMALSLGRTAMARANAEEVGKEVITAVMDKRTCAPCKDADGTEYPVGEGPSCPLPQCLGGSRCRCVRIPVALRRSK